MRARRVPASMLFFVITLVTVVALAAAQSGGERNVLPNSTLLTQDGVPVKFYDDLLKGKAVAIEFICTQCNQQTIRESRLYPLQRRLGTSVGREIFFYSITIDPVHDSPSVLRKYAKTHGAGPGWLFLTGKREDIDQIISILKALDAIDVDDTTHLRSLLVGNARTGQWRRTVAFDYPLAMLTAIDDIVDGDEIAFATGNHDRNTSKSAQHLFRDECAGCHTIGRGDRVGPDLQFVTRRRRQRWLKNFISSPSKIIDSKDATATALYEKYGLRMPTIGLSDVDIASMIEYLAYQDVRPSHSADVSHR